MTEKKKIKTHKCEGVCSLNNECVGIVKKMIVIGHGRNWGTFYYCDKAIELDTSNGFVCKEAK